MHPFDDGVEIPLPSYEEVKVSIMRLKSNKATGPDGLHTELFNARSSLNNQQESKVIKLFPIILLKLIIENYLIIFR